MKKGKKRKGDLVWFVGKSQSGKIFYVADYDNANNTVMWTVNKKDGLSFKTELTVWHFIYKHLHSRTDIILVHAPYD